MIPEAQRIAIAKACPGRIWKDIDDPTWWYGSNEQCRECVDNDPLSDLNAMHEAEKVIVAQSKWVTYDEILKELLAIKQPTTTFATAAQRAEAFLKTLNLWKPDLSPDA